MTARISHTTFDCTDAYALSLFWSAVLGFAEDPDDPNGPGHEECLIAAPDGGQRLLFIEGAATPSAPRRPPDPRSAPVGHDPVATVGRAVLSDPAGRVGSDAHQCSAVGALCRGGALP
ncbi:VOC family protein [Modestobacter excelsi]|uniref:VOC family protein n=1 Tax=Modestobacter excelsi TaxID=2213161 RepID=UPI001C20EED4|nr:VOC family protein [Modestobacter excelsi]